jgi:hypothetical protein
VTKEVTKEVTHKVTEAVTLDLKTEAVLKALKADKLTIDEIADYNNVSVEFVLDIKEEMNK